jgi:hypothetical protein
MIILVIFGRISAISAGREADFENTYYRAFKNTGLQNA